MRLTRFILALVALWTSASAIALAAEFDVKQFGTKGDGTTLDTAAINQAIEAAAAAGGGTVRLSAGTYLCYSIHLKSNITLFLDQGATILAADPPAEGQTGGYDTPEPNDASEHFHDFGHGHWHNSLIWGENLENVCILGPGRIFGRGLSRGNGRKALPPGETLPEEQKHPGDVLGADGEIAPPPSSSLVAGPFGYPNARDTLPAGVGNKTIALKNCRNVIFRDFTIFHGGHFAILATAVDNWTCDNLKIDTNRDGIDFDCCQNVRVSNCAVNSPYDDGICPKSSFGLGYNRIAENITITNCQVSGYDEGTLLDGTRQRKIKYLGGPTGRIKCGTESNGGFRNITISNCVFEYCRGFALESVDGAVMEDITVSNLAMRDITNTPIFIRLGARLRGPKGTTVGTARRIKIQNVVAHNVSETSGILIFGTKDHPVEDLSLSDIFIDYVGGGTVEQGQREVPGYETLYPEPVRYGIIPAWALWARHLKNFEMHHVSFRAQNPDLRPALMFEDAQDIQIDHANIPQAKASGALVLKRVQGISLQQCADIADVRKSDPIAHEKF